jgi:parvulin-like peptidyl-prolyl isomerase
MGNVRNVVLAGFIISLSYMNLSTTHCGVVNKVVAIVNGEVIFSDDLERAVSPAIEQFKKLTPPEQQTKERINELKKLALDQLIEERLLVQEGKKRNIKVTKYEVSQAINKLKLQFKSEEEFNEELKKQKLTMSSFEKRVQDQLIAIKLIEQEVKPKVVLPTESEAKALFDKVVARMENKAVPGVSPKEEEELNLLAQLLRRAVSERVRVRHILIRVDKDATEAEKRKAREKIEKILSRIKKGEDFSELAKEYSEDTGSRDRGGDLGYIVKGDGSDIPEFEKAAFQLQVGEVSGIVETKYGYHIIKCEEKRAAMKPKFEDLKNDFLEYIFQRRNEEEYKKFVDKLKEKATIKTYSLD